MRSQLVSAVVLVTGLAGSAAAQTSPYVGDWTGYWNGRGWVEYDVLKATRRGLSVRYGYKQPPDGHVVAEVIRCSAVSETAFNCGPSTIVFTSATTAEATMHAQSGATATAELSR